MPPGNATNVYSVNKTTIAAPPAGSGSLGGAAAASPSDSSVPLMVMTAVTKIITLRSKLNWIGEASMFLGIMSGDSSM